MTTRISVSLPDDLHSGLLRLAESSNVSTASVVRAILSDIVPRMTSVLDYIGTSPTVTQDDVSEADAWLKDLTALYDRAPKTYRDVVGDFPIFGAPPAASGND